jgi:hypothetical protein
MAIVTILCSFGAVFSGFGIMCQEKSGNPVPTSATRNVLEKRPKFSKMTQHRATLDFFD